MKSGTMSFQMSYATLFRIMCRKCMCVHLSQGLRPVALAPQRQPCCHLGTNCMSSFPWLDGLLGFCGLVFVLLNFSASRCAGWLAYGCWFSKHFRISRAENGSRCWWPKLLFGRPGASILAPWRTTPLGHLGGPWQQQDERVKIQNRFFEDWGAIMGSYCESCLGTKAWNFILLRARCQATFRADFDSKPGRLLVNR